MCAFRSEFVKVLSFGTIVNKDSWKCGNYLLRNGYVGIRQLFVDDCRKLYCFCKIEDHDHENRPIFKCITFDVSKNNKDEIESLCVMMMQVNQQVQQQGNLISQKSGIKISSVVKDCIKSLGLTSKKNWPGTNFFGLSSADFRHKLLEEEIEETIKINGNLVSGSSPAASFNQVAEDNSEDGFRYEWVDVISYGEFRDDENFIHNGIPINVGFTSERKITRQKFSLNIKCIIGMDERLVIYLCIHVLQNLKPIQIFKCQHVLKSFCRK